MTTTSGMPVEHAKIGPAADDCGRRWRVQPGTWVTRAHGQHSAPPSRWRRNEDRVAREKLRPEERSDEVAASPESRGAPPMRQRGRSRCRSRRTVSGHMGDTALERHDRPRALVQHTEPRPSRRRGSRRGPRRRACGARGPEQTLGHIDDDAAPRGTSPCDEERSDRPPVFSSRVMNPDACSQSPRAFSGRSALDALTQVAVAVHRAHRRGRAHRHIRPRVAALRGPRKAQRPEALGPQGVGLPHVLEDW
jgi:hypothetical protein